MRPLPEISPRYLYDDHGSVLFERITQLEVYYQTRTEIGILERNAAGLLDAARPLHLVELGSGAGRKIRLLLDAWQPGVLPKDATCTMLDVNALFLEDSVRRLQADYPRFTFRGIVGDFTSDLDQLGPGGRRLTVFFAGTVGNLYPEQRRQFFQALARQMDASDRLLVGVDLVKDRARLEAAYNDPEGVTAAFNLNALRVLNGRFDGNFDPEGFAHRAFYDAENAWIEMRLVARRPMRVRLDKLDLDLELATGVELRTEVSCKFTRESLQAVAAEAGLGIDRWCQDAEALFGLALLKRVGA